MSDPRFTDPRYSDTRLSDPVLRSEASAGGTWGWIAGLAVLALVAFVVIAGWNSGGNNTASNTPPPITTGSAPSGGPNGAPMRNVTPPSTTGSGSTSPAPMAPGPAQSPAPRQ